MEQQFINTLIVFGGAIFGWLFRTLWTAVKDLQRADSELAEKVNRIEVLVASGYVTREEFDRHMVRLFSKLDAIEEKVSHKADRGAG